MFKVLSEPVRVRLVLLLSWAERNVSELVKALNLPQSTVSRHLTILRTAELMRVEHRGTSAIYRLADAHLAALLAEALSHAQHERWGSPTTPPSELR